MQGWESACAQVIVELRQLGGRIAEQPQHPSAYCGRDVAFSLLTIGIAAGPVTAVTDADAVLVADAVVPWAMDRQLPNSGPGADPAQVRRICDAEVLQRLDALRVVHDPAGVLAAADPIRDAAAAERG